MKKALSIMTVVFILTVSLNGCGQKQVNNPKVNEPKEEKYDMKGYTVRIVNPWDDNTPSKSSPIYQELTNEIKKIEKKFNCKIKYILNSGEASSFISSALAGDTDCDIAYFDCEMYPGVILKNLVMPIDNYIDLSLKQWSKDVTEMCFYNGKHYGFFKESRGGYEGVYFNKTIFESNGLPDLYELDKNKQWTWDKLREIAKLATKDTNGDGKIDQWGYGCDNTNVPEFGGLVTSNGGTFMKRENGKYIFAMDDPAVLEALQFGSDLYNIDKVVPTDNPGKLFVDGKLAMFDAGIWFCEGLKKNMSSYKVGLVWFPLGPKGKEHINMNPDPYFAVFPATAKYPKEAGKIITELWGPHPWDADPKIMYESKVNDESAVNTLMDMYNARTVQSPWWSIPFFRSKIFWGYKTFAIEGKLSAQAWVESLKVAAQKSIDDAWAVIK